MGGCAPSSETIRRYYSSPSRDHIHHATDYKQVFKSNNMKDAYNPAKMKLPREACDSPECPRSRGIIYAQDFTGSMGDFSLSLVQKEAPRLIRLTNESVSYNPQIMYMGVGDVEVGDEAPLQVTQFEADMKMLDQLQELWIEGGGGINRYESYILPWYFAAKHVKMDCYDKRGEKGFLFTFGDECPTPSLTASEISTVFGDNDSLKQVRMLTAEDCLDMVSKKFHCYHIILHGWYYEHNSDVIGKWKNLLGSHVCDLSNHHYLPELISTILRMYEGDSKDEAISKIEDSSAIEVVKDALKWHEDNVVDEKERRKARGVETF